jgi:hypothetical protein
MPKKSTSSPWLQWFFGPKRLDVADLDKQLVPVPAGQIRARSSVRMSSSCALP